MQLKNFIGLAIIVFLSACNNKNNSGSNADVLLAQIDTAVKPGDNFFMYANGAWYSKTQVPGDESAWGIGYMVQDDIYKKLRKINEDAAKADAKAGTLQQQIGDFWKSGMDSAIANRSGLMPLKIVFQNIDSMSNTDDLIEVAASLKRKGVRNLLFNDYITQDDKNSEVMAVRLDQGGLGMPNRDYYFNTDEGTEKVRKAYNSYLFNTFWPFSPANAKSMGNEVVALEKQLAGSSLKLEDLRDPIANYNKMSWSQLAAVSPGVNWELYKTEAGLNVDSIIIGQPKFFSTLSGVVKNTPLRVWKNYFKMRTIQSFAPYLDDSTYSYYFNYRAALTGATEQKPRWKRVLDAEERVMGEALGQLFVKEYFSEDAKKRYEDMVENVRTAYKERIGKLTWMSDATKQKAYEKLGAISKKVGYPNKWKNFSDMNISSGAWVKNMMSANEWWYNYDLNKLGKPVDRTEWGMSPQTYNAYYNPSNNEIVLPAGIFTVPGFMDADVDEAVAYGYAGASTIGHEITHGFDDQGRQYDSKGNLTDWWTAEDAAEFNKRAAFIVRQFNEFTPIDTIHVNGEATQGENIADLGGLLIGLDAFKKTETFKEGKKINGYTPLQRFFLGYALGWMYKIKPESLRSNLITDVHAPAIERVNGPMPNIPEFYEAFNVQPGDKMYRPDSLRVNIW